MVENWLKIRPPKRHQLLHTEVHDKQRNSSPGAHSGGESPQRTRAAKRPQLAESPATRPLSTRFAFQMLLGGYLLKGRSRFQVNLTQRWTNQGSKKCICSVNLSLSSFKNLLLPLFLTKGCFPRDFEEGKRPIKAFGEMAH